MFTFIDPTTTNYQHSPEYLARDDLPSSAQFLHNVTNWQEASRADAS